jgi:hypothetical protein
VARPLTAEVSVALLPTVEANVRWQRIDFMGPFNWIDVTAACPACGSNATLRAQTHIASSYDGDSTGRFHERTYRLGETMAWFERSDVRRASWTDAADPAYLMVVREACYGACSSCGVELCIVLEFENAAPTSVVTITRVTDWPTGYLR